MTTLELQYVSPKLLEARDLELAVPGIHLINISYNRNFGTIYIVLLTKTIYPHMILFFFFSYEKVHMR